MMPDSLKNKLLFELSLGSHELCNNELKITCEHWNLAVVTGRGRHGVTLEGTGTGAITERSLSFISFVSYCLFQQTRNVH